MAVVRQKLGCDHDVSEFFSPPRVVKMARELGLFPFLIVFPFVLFVLSFLISFLIFFPYFLF